MWFPLFPSSLLFFRPHILTSMNSIVRFLVSLAYLQKWGRNHATRSRRIDCRDVNIGFLGKPVIGFGNPVLNRFSKILGYVSKDRPHLKLCGWRHLLSPLSFCPCL